MRSEIELLAPAANAEIGIEAVNHGADAVYIGGPAFGARANAGNAVADIARLTAHAHRYNARIFATLNTILRDDELEPARTLIWELYDAGVDALIVQDMGVLELDLPPIQLHASTQADIRSPEKARFLADVGFSQIVLARELSLPQIAEIAGAVPADTVLEFFIHGALCVAYSGQCYLSHAQTGRSANRGDCSQPCRLPYTLTDTQGRVVAHDRHLLSLKDNDQTENLEALIDAGVRSFKIEGRYKDMAYVKNVTAHYRQRLDAILAQRGDLRAASSGRCRFSFAPDPARNFQRGNTDYFVQGRNDAIGSFDTPKHAGLPVGHVARVAPDHIEVETVTEDVALNNGDGLTYYTLQKDLSGLQVNRAVRIGPRRWRIEPNQALAQCPDLRVGTEIARNRDAVWNRMLDGPSAERRIGVRWSLREEDGVLRLHLRDGDGNAVTVAAPQDFQAAQDGARAAEVLRGALGKLGSTAFVTEAAPEIAWHEPRFVPASVANAWRRDAVSLLEAGRARGWSRLPRKAPADPPPQYPADSLSYLGNVANGKAAAFYRRHGVQMIEAAYESHAETGEVSLMITRHCIRYSLSLCPKQAKGVIGVQGTVRAEPMTLVNGKERLTLQFDCKACEMHVLGKIKPSVLAAVPAVPVRFPTRGQKRSQKDVTAQ